MLMKRIKELREKSSREAKLSISHLFDIEK